MDKTRARLILAAALLFAGCGGDDGGTKPERTGTLTLHFNYKVGSEALTFGGTPHYTNLAGNRFNVVGFKHYICDVVLRRENGTKFESNALVLVNVEDPSSRQLVVSDIPSGRYESISFLIGVDDARNADGKLTSLEDFNMSWPPSLGGGYHNVKLEGYYEPSDGAALIGYGVHLGKMRHEDEPDHFHNHNTEILLQHADLAIDGERWRAEIEMDLNQWFQDPVLFDFRDVFTESNTTTMTSHVAQQTISVDARDSCTLLSLTKE